MWFELLMVDLKRLWVSPKNWLAMVLFSIIVLLMVHFSLPPAHGRPPGLGVTAVWLALLLSSVIGLPPLQHHPDARRFVSQLVTAGVSPTEYYWEKAIVGLIMLIATTLLVIGPAAVLFQFPLDDRLWLTLPVLGLGCLGFAVVMTLCAALTTGQGVWLLPLMAFPLLIPLLMAGTTVMSSVLDAEQVFSNPWFLILVSYDVLMISLASLLSEFLWEEVPQ